METLTRSTSKLWFDYKYKHLVGEIGAFSSSSSCRRTHVVPLTPTCLRFFHSYSYSSSSSSSISFSLSSSLSHPQQTSFQDDEDEEDSQIEQGPSKTVRVKFHLQRECSFGERFHILGDDPIIGLWDPSSAIPMDWSDEHVWSVELDMPIGKPIHYKFILIANSGNVLWQPGPDRILQTWETDNTISISDDWENAELRKVAEDQPILCQKESVTYSDSADAPLAIVAENITYSNEKIQDVLDARDTSCMKEETAVVSDGDLATGGSAFGDNGKAATVDNFMTTKEDESIPSYKGVPILVPGLDPLPSTATEEASPVEDKGNTIAGASFGETKEHNVAESYLKDEPDSNSHHLKEATEMMHSDDKELHGYEQIEKSILAREQDLVNSEPLENEVLQNDIQWGRRTLQKFLANLGFL